MTYLYGDSTPFPLQENFLETLRDLVSASVALLRAEGAIRDAQEQSSTVDNDETADQEWLSELENAAVIAIDHHRSRAPRDAIRYEADALERQIRSYMAHARQASNNRCHGELKDLENIIDSEQALATDAIKSFMLKHALPETQWQFRWQTTSDAMPPSADASCETPEQLSASFRLQIPESSPLSKASRVLEWGETPVLRLNYNGRTRKIRLRKLWLEEVAITADSIRISLVKKLDGDRRGLEIETRWDAGQFRIHTVGKDEDTFLIDEEDAPEVARLIHRFVEELTNLRDERVAAYDVKVADAPAGESPARIAQLLIDSTSPFVSELIARSNSPHELCLKRDVGSCMREELFLPVHELTDQIKLLPERLRSYFEPYQLPVTGGSHEPNGTSAPDPTQHDRRNEERFEHDLSDDAFERPTLLRSLSLVSDREKDSEEPVGPHTAKLLAIT